MLEKLLGYPEDGSHFTIGASRMESRSAQRITDKIGSLIHLSGAIFILTFFLGLIAFSTLTASPIYAQEVADWSGEWDSRWRGGGARLILKQDGNHVTGTYPLYNGSIVAEADGRELKGRWSQPGAEGEFLFIMSREGDTFAGRYSSGEWWTGIRARVIPRPEIPIDQSSPMATMRSFLRASNEIGPGTLDLLGTAASLIVPDRAIRGSQLSRIDFAQKLFQVVDKLTFRLWDLPRAPEGDEVTVTFRQAGTLESIDLTFQRIGDEWFILPPPVDELDATLQRFESARSAGAPEEEGAGEHANDDLRSPRDTFKTFISGMVEHGLEPDNPALKTLNTSHMTEVVRRQEAPLLARYIMQVIDRIGYVYWQEIPDDPYSDTPYVHYQHPEGDIIVAPVETENGVIWQFTPETLDNIRAVYAAVDDLPVPPELESINKLDSYFLARGFIRETMPGLLQRAGPLERWQWLAMLGTLAIGYGLAMGVSWGAFRIARRTKNGKDEDPAPHAVFAQTVVKWAIRATVLGIALLLALYILGLPDVVATAVTATAWTLIVIGMVPLIWQGLTVTVDAYRRGREVPGRHDTLLSLGTGIARVGIVVAAALVLAEVLDLPYQGVIAGLGISGIAVALAAQPTLQNFLAGFTLYADQPVAVGNFCRYGEKVGTIEHIGMRSTRIRSLDRTVVTVPNSHFANLELENYAKRDRIWLSTSLQLRYETTPDQLRYVLAALRELLIAHPKVAADPLRVRFTGFGEYSLDIEIYAYLLTPDYNESKAIQEDLFLRMMGIVEEAGAQFAFPSTVEYQAKDVPPDIATTRKAEKTVAEWRRTGRLPFPDHTWQDKAEVSNTLDYPPKGSALAEEMQNFPFENPSKNR